MVAIRLFDTISGLSVPAAAIAGAAMLIPRAAPMTLRKTARLIPRDAHTIASTILSWHCPSCWFYVRREAQPGPFIKLAKPFNPVKPQSLHENYQTLNYHDQKIAEKCSTDSERDEECVFEIEICNVQCPDSEVRECIAGRTEKRLKRMYSSFLPAHEH